MTAGTGGAFLVAPALGCMRLSTAPDRDAERSVALLHEALDAGVRFLDTADVYCHDERDIGHNERLVARALASWNGDTSAVTVATKGGLTRPGGGWVPDGRARHLAAACEASRRALGVERISLYQLHAPDPRVALATSVRALARLRDEGRVEAIGLCNVTVGQIREAERIVPIAAVQVELSPWRDDNLLNGVAEYCRDRGLPILAYRPLGGPERRARVLDDPVLRKVAARLDATPFEIALAWLHDLSPLVRALPGATRGETLRSIVRASRIVLDEQDRAELDERFPSGRLLREKASARRSPPSRDGEVVLVMGLPAAGKSTLALALAREGYERLNRDEAGGTVRDLLPALDRLSGEGKRRIVMDNTYVSRRSRRPVLEKARTLGLSVRCVWLDTSIEDAQVNAVERMVARHGRLLGPEEIKRAARHDPGAFAPAVQFRMKRELEPPSVEEGFSRVEVVRFARRRDPSLTGRALFLWCEDVLVRSRSGRRAPVSPDDVEALPGRARVLRRHAEEGWRLLGLSWRPEIAEGALTRDEANAVHARMGDVLGVPLEVLYCPHPAGPPVCWCRKPLPGLGVVAVLRHRLDVGQSAYVGAGVQDAAFARRLGLAYRDATEFFASP
jgi:aryl-alcohol dehydrogenase-like predicted oxidoreductase/histidinol phosphatase-like enzyme/predicted kinase